MKMAFVKYGFVHLATRRFTFISLPGGLAGVRFPGGLNGGKHFNGGTMTARELVRVANLTSGTIATLTGLARYEDQDRFIAWLFKPVSRSIGIFNGELADFGDNILFACQNAGRIYQNHGD